MLRLLLLLALAANAAGCSTIYSELTRDRRDAPWDPPQGRALHEQIPNWSNPTSRCCGGERSCRPDQTPRC